MAFYSNYWTFTNILFDFEEITSSSSLSSWTVGVCVFSWIFDTASPCTLNFSAAASWACWERSSIWSRQSQISKSVHKRHKNTDGNKNATILTEISPLLTNSVFLTYLCFTKDNICVWCWALVDVWFSDDKQDVLWLANSDSGYTRYLP